MNQSTSTPLPPPPPPGPLATTEAPAGLPAALPASLPAALPVALLSQPAPIPTAVPAPLTWEPVARHAASAGAPAPQRPLVPVTSFLDSVRSPGAVTPLPSNPAASPSAAPKSPLGPALFSAAPGIVPNAPAPASTPPPPASMSAAHVEPAPTALTLAMAAAPASDPLVSGAATVGMVAAPIRSEPVAPVGSARVVTDPNVVITTTEPNAAKPAGLRRKLTVAALAVASAAVVGVLASSMLGGSDDAAIADNAVVRPQAPAVDPLDNAAGSDPVGGGVAELPAADLPPVEAASAADSDETVGNEIVGDSASADVGAPAPDPAVDAGGVDDVTASPVEAPAEPGADVETPAQTTDEAQQSADAAAADGAALPTDQPADPATPADTADPVASAGEVVESKGIVRNGQIYLEGAVPTAEAGAQIEALAAEVLGPDNVFNNYVVDPRAGDPNLGNLTVEDTINFPANNAVILSQGEGLLNQGLALLTIRPSMTIAIVGHTDARGSTEQNQLLSEQRAESVKQWFVDRGVDGDRLTTQGAGEDDPIADNSTADGQRLNRRIQFFLENILG